MSDGSLVGIGLGSNLGDRQAHLTSAIAELSCLGSDIRLASFLETEPVDCPEASPGFLNTVMLMEYQGDLFDLLLMTQQLEKGAGRESKADQVKNAPRPLDLDILFYGQQLLNHHQLILPHPRMMDRLFVLEPLAELIPNFRPYPDRPTISERVKELKSCY